MSYPNQTFGPQTGRGNLSRQFSEQPPPTSPLDIPGRPARRLSQDPSDHGTYAHSPSAARGHETAPGADYGTSPNYPPVSTSYGTRPVGYGISPSHTVNGPPSQMPIPMYGGSPGTQHPPLDHGGPAYPDTSTRGQHLPPVTSNPAQLPPVTGWQNPGFVPMSYSPPISPVTDRSRRFSSPSTQPSSLGSLDAGEQTWHKERRQSQSSSLGDNKSHHRRHSHYDDAESKDRHHRERDHGGKGEEKTHRSKDTRKDSGYQSPRRPTLTDSLLATIDGVKGAFDRRV